MKRLEQEKAKTNKQELVKVLMQKGNEVYKDGEKVRKQFVKGELSTEQFIA